MTQHTIVALSLGLLLSACGDTLQLPPDAILPDGSQYSGDIVDGLFHGDGKLQYASGASYVGEFENGLFNGRGTYKYNDGSGDVYTGEFQQGLMHGRGELITQHGDIYTGEFAKDNFSGQGSLTDKDQSYEYTGGFKDWRYHGNGHFKNSDSEYTGQLVDGYYHGKGTLTEGNISYTGDFERGEYSGSGLYTYGDDNYQGHFSKGQLNGLGSFKDDEKHSYIGEFVDWYYHGPGHFTDDNGDQYIGKFADGYPSGMHKYIGADGSSYSGEFKEWDFHGMGQLTLADGGRYKGQFNEGYYHGEGELISINTDGSLSTQRGRWNWDKWVYDSDKKQAIAGQTELAIQHQQTLLNEHLAQLKPTDAARINSYFLGIAGYGKQSVFKREVNYISDYFTQHFDSAGRSISLINHHQGADLTPMATLPNITASLSALEDKMDTQQDILFVYMTSHGSREHEFSITHDSMKLQDLRAEDWGQLIQQHSAKWKVVMVSACYSGGFIPALKSPNTLIMTAASSERRSFGCSEQSEMTYFAKALFQEALPNKHSFVSAFEHAEKVIQEWEEEQDLTPSQPQISKPKAILGQLQRWREQLPTDIKKAL